MRGNPLTKKELQVLYVDKKLSAKEIGTLLGCSQNKVFYWLARTGIKIRSQSDATYVKRNPNGDPFNFRYPTSQKDAVLFGAGLGLYWGEGTKKSLTAVRLGNTDPALVRIFIEFLIKLYRVERTKFRFGLQIFSDMDPGEALTFWVKKLGFPRSSFGKVIVTPARSIGTYREKTKHGVLTVYVSNKKLRDLLMNQIENIKDLG